MSLPLAGRLAVVVGAAGGIGRELSVLLHGAGMSLALLDLDAVGLSETALLLGSDNPVSLHCVDVSDATAVEAIARGILSIGGPPTVLVSSIGLLGPHERAWEVSEHDWHAVMGANLDGPVNIVRGFGAAMHACEHPSRIVIIASMAGIQAQGSAVVYAAAKHALVSFAETLSLHLRAESSAVGVRLVCPGGVPTNLNKAVRANVTPEAAARWLTAEEVAHQIVEALPRDDLYVFTHPDSAPRLRRYHEQLLEPLVRQPTLRPTTLIHPKDLL